MEAKAVRDGKGNQNSVLLVSGLISIMSFPAGSWGEEEGRIREEKGRPSSLTRHDWNSLKVPVPTQSPGPWEDHLVQQNSVNYNFVNMNTCVMCLERQLLFPF